MSADNGKSRTFNWQSERIPFEFPGEEVDIASLYASFRWAP
ncbi:predicted protein [Plenodomus lingam JN3]|uniref:Predicted protein n=1 Tax=Leptosphaeria maculans (strain JN3 / isolate v23.1.3 / race Av1-4-5-6-7-8) TaxID=985895 RepID=E4ZS04_LEPMJ|nr:predicted protein [Plenodomus lingam JN3]CBX94184.1 predicted protein [Plenodomus lingam JN3]